MAYHRARINEIRGHYHCVHFTLDAGRFNTKELRDQLYQIRVMFHDARLEAEIQNARDRTILIGAMELLIEGQLLGPEYLAQLDRIEGLIYNDEREFGTALTPLAKSDIPHNSHRYNRGV